MSSKVLAAAALFACTIYSQPPPGRAPVDTPVNALVSPEVNADRTVTLRSRAPMATEVDVVGEVTLGKGLQPMVRDAAGLWTATVGPLAPEIWSYNFRVQGIDIPDPSNPAIKPVPPGSPISSFVEVPGDAPAFYDARPVLHGNGETQDGRVIDGRANFILDNLIAAGKAQPMVIVMPQGHALQAAGVAPLVRIPGETAMYSDRFPKDLLEDVMPLVDKNYRVVADADHRAIAGLSMGGGQALAIGLAHPGLFHYILGYSAAISAQFMDADAVFRPLLTNPASINKSLRLLWLSCGRQDFIYDANRQFTESLRARGVNETP